MFIRATPEQIWEAITTPEWSDRYGYRGKVEYDLRPGGAFRSIAPPEYVEQGMPEVVTDGEVIEADPPRRLVQTWNARWNDEPPTRLTYEIEVVGGVSRLTVTHELTDAPETAAMTAGEIEDAGGGWPYVLSDLKSVLETGEPLAA